MAPRRSGRARGQVGCRAQAWGGVQEHSKTATPPPELRKGQSSSPGALGPRQDCSPLIFSPVGSSSQQLRDGTHTRNPGSSQGGADLRSQSRQQPMESGPRAPEREGPVLPEASFPHGRGHGSGFP